MNDIISYAWHCEISNDSNDHENEISRISWRKEGFTVILHLGNVNLQHILLYFSNDAAEDIGDRQPEKYINVPRNPDR